MSDESRNDITEQVHGIVQNHEIWLTAKGKPIGKVPLTRLQLESGYQLQDNRIIEADQTENLEKDQYADNCDMGWC